MLSLLPVFALALAPPPADSTFCETWLNGPDLPIAIARIEVDRAHAVVDTTLLYSTREFRIGWNVKGGSLNESSVQTRLSLPTFTLAPDTAFPVTLTFLIDGQEVMSRRFDELTALVVHSGVGPPPWAGPERRSFYPGVELDVVPGFTPNLVGARNAQLVGTTASGQRIGVIDLPLPDWNELAEDAAKAFVEMEAQRMQRKCTVDLRIIVSSSH